MVATQCRCEKYIVLSLRINNIFVLTAAQSIAMLCYGVAVAVFPTYAGVYMTCVCSQEYPACQSSLIKTV